MNLNTTALQTDQDCADSGYKEVQVLKESPESGIQTPPVQQQQTASVQYTLVFQTLH